MQYLSVYDEAFNAYGRVLSGYDTKPLIEAMRRIPHELSAEDLAYVRKNIELLFFSKN